MKLGMFLILFYGDIKTNCQNTQRNTNLLFPHLSKFNKKFSKRIEQNKKEGTEEEEKKKINSKQKGGFKKRKTKKERLLNLTLRSN